MKERTNGPYIFFSEVAFAISMNPLDRKERGRFSTGRKSWRKLLTGTGPTKACRISMSKEMWSSAARGNGDTEQSTKVCCVYLTGVELSGFDADEFGGLSSGWSLVG